MKNAVNALYRTGIFRILAALVLVTGLWAHDGFAATVRFEVLPDRERLTVSLNKEEGFAGQVNRVARTGLLLELGVPTEGMVQELAPENAEIFKYTEPRGRALGIFMRTAAFGYVVTRPDNFTVIINVYSDPLGERWRPAGEPEDPPGSGGQASPESAQAAPDNQAGQDNNSQVSRETPSPGVNSGTEPAGDANVARGVIEKEPGKTVDAVAPGNASSARDTSVHGSQVFREKLNPGGVADWLAIHPDSPVSGAAPPGNASPPSASPGFSPGASPGAAPGDSPGASSPVPPAAEKEKSAPGQQDSVPARPGEPGATGNAETPGKTDAAGTGQPSAPEKVYTDAQGNPIPPPPDPVQALAEVRNEVNTGNYKAALEKVTALLTHPELTRQQTEEVLHLHSEMLFMVHHNDLAANFDAIASATIAALNYNPDSPHNAAAYLRLGYINLRMGNTVEADAYFTRLRRMFPLDENIPLTYYYWGQYYYDRGEMQAAADEFQYIISNYAESKFAREAALGLARAYVTLGYYQEAYDIIEYVERRWPRLYLQAPAVLELMGDVGYRVGKLDFALSKYMTYYNLMPDGPSADVILTRIGDVYARKRQLAAAKAAYQLAADRFPDKDGGLVAMMRLAEVGIHDAPQLHEMLSVFKDQRGRTSFRAADIYNKIIKEHPESDLAPLAMLKLAMWNMAQMRYEAALELSSELVKRYPKHELVPHAEEVAMKAFDALAAEGAQQKRSGRVLSNWSDNPILQKQSESLSPASRVALAYSMYSQNDPDGALETIMPMFFGRKDPEKGEEALQLALMINLDHDRWDAIEKLAGQIALWELTPKAKGRLDYALALARENLGKSAEAAPLWERLARTGALSEKEQAYAEFFLAKDAENKRKLQEAHTYGTSALSRFLRLAEQNPAEADTGKINSLLSSLIDITETAGRLDEALGYANQFMASLPENDPQRQGMLFRIAGIYKKQGNTPEWRKTLTELAQNYPDSVHGRAAASTLRAAQLSEDAAKFSPDGSL